MSLSARFYAASSRDAWERGFSVIATLLNEIMERRGLAIRVSMRRPYDGSEFKAALLRFVNSLYGIRPLSLDLPGDSSLPLWSLGRVNGPNNSQVIISLGGPYSNEHDVNEVLEFLESKTWTEEEWASNIVKAVEGFSKIWRTFFDELEAETSLENPPHLDADSVKKETRGMPDNPDVRDLCHLLSKNEQKTSRKKSEMEVARGFTKEKTGDDRKAKNLLRQARRFPHLWKTSGN